jgi:hypothetical protein
MLFRFPGAERRPARKLDDLRRRAVTGLRVLTQMTSGKHFTSGDLDGLRVLIESWPMAGSESGLAASRLCKAQRYLRSNELGAARYELQLLLDCLQSC